MCRHVLGREVSVITGCVRMTVTAGAVLVLLSSASCSAQKAAPQTTVPETTAPQSVAAIAGADQGWGQPVVFGGQQTGALMADVSCPAPGGCAAVGMDHSSAS